MAARRRKQGTWRSRLGMGAMVLLLVVLAGWSIHSARQPGRWQRVFATREGLIGGITSSRTIIRADSMFVALPHRRALGRMVEVRYRNLAVVVPVLDVGPWNETDAYWETDARPASESKRGTYRIPVNPSGIDLSNAVFAALGLHDNDYVEWRFVHRGYIALPRL